MLNDKEQTLVASFIFSCGHANVQFSGDKVIYRDQTRGKFAQFTSMDVAPILAVVRGKSIAQIERMIFTAEVNQTLSENPTGDEERTNDVATMLDLVNLPYPFETFAYPLGANFYVW